MLPGLAGLSGHGAVAAGGGGGGTSAEYTAFIARTSGLDSTHLNAYGALIDGLVSDGVWSKLDVLHIYATQDSTTALLNLVSSSFNGTSHGSPTFTADRGFTGVDGSSTVYIDTGFNPTVGSPLWAQNNAHLSVWIAANASSTHYCVGAKNGSTENQIKTLDPGSGNSVYHLQEGPTGNGVVTSGGADGFHLVTRPAVSSMIGYRNAVQKIANTPGTASALNLTIYSLAANASGTADGASQQEAMISMGSGMSATNVTNFYNRLRTFMTAVGVP